MANPEYQSRGEDFTASPDENPISLQQQLENTEDKLEENEVNEIIERTRNREHLEEEKEAIENEISSQNTSDI